MALQAKADRRVIYTKGVIRDSFLGLLDEKPLEKISVTEICKKAGINRGTFYSHYSDPFDLKKQLENEVIRILAEASAEAQRTRGQYLSPLEALTLINDNKELCRVFCSPGGSIDALMGCIGNFSEDYLRDMLSSVTSISAARMNCLRLMLTASISAVVRFWFDNDFKYSPEVIAEVMQTFCLKGINGFI